jgi:hypothetical protein
LRFARVAVTCISNELIAEKVGSQRPDNRLLGIRNFERMQLQENKQHIYE